ncbi:MAG: hypothetical protein A2X61_06785 [Ignavibacteria bacterium GWB2_35_12]|nr:MAG: hypothetical protein A2X63_10620 [Ignavibacteria bacterium GWA2_35_8]OGU40089.1 MAG: hypothetical protein A2X61_06785 [Ignavibacteria bacterium GWB2_35_12]OGV22019.1 MAG: hypothetical protein A2475_09285 [Ignavibacteria bacterium RIFOXYC2_FULL_35_21]
MLIEYTKLIKEMTEIGKKTQNEEENELEKNLGIMKQEKLDCLKINYHHFSTQNNFNTKKT